MTEKDKQIENILNSLAQKLGENFKRQRKNRTAAKYAAGTGFDKKIDGR